MILASLINKKDVELALSTIKDAIDRGIKVNIKIEKSPRRLIITYPTHRVSVQLPLSLTLIQTEGQLKYILLLTKKIIGQGGERTVKLCFNLTTGEYLAKKRVVNSIEKTVVQFFRNKGAIGIAPIYLLREVLLTPTLSKIQMIEPLYAGPLTILFGTRVLARTEQKLSIMSDLLYGLANLHTCTLNNLTFQRNSWDKKVELGAVKMFHKDIKPGNILVRYLPDEDRWEAVISDFGSAGQVSAFGGTLGYKAPEEVRFQLEQDTWNLGHISDTMAIIKHNLNFGQAMDVWSLGLVLVEVLSGKLSTRLNEAPFPPIASIEECFFRRVDPFGYSPEPRHPDEKIADLRQADIDQDLTQLQSVAKCLNQDEALVLKKSWDLIRIQMLKVNPMQRKSAQETLNEFTTFAVKA